MVNLLTDLNHADTAHNYTERALNLVTAKRDIIYTLKWLIAR